MTLIIKELVIRGIVSSEHSSSSDSIDDLEAIQKMIKEMRTNLKQECIESILRKIETRKTR